MNILNLLKFFFFNKKKYKPKNSEKKILVEVFDYKADYITYSIFGNALADIYNAELTAYYPTILSSKKKIINLIKRTFFLNILEKIFFHLVVQVFWNQMKVKNIKVKTYTLKTNY